MKNFLFILAWSLIVLGYIVIGTSIYNSESKSNDRDKHKVRVKKMNEIRYYSADKVKLENYRAIPVPRNQLRKKPNRELLPPMRQPKKVDLGRTPEEWDKVREEARKRL